MNFAAKVTVISFVVLISTYVCASTWQDVTTGLTDGEFYSVAENKGKLYVGTSSGLYVKNCGDNIWTRIFTCRGQYKGIRHILIDGGGSIYIATKNGLYMTDNSWRNWKRIFRGIGKGGSQT